MERVTVLDKGPKLVWEIKTAFVVQKEISGQPENRLLW